LPGEHIFAPPDEEAPQSAGDNENSEICDVIKGSQTVGPMI
jgi:hypothetical protein